MSILDKLKSRIVEVPGSNPVSFNLNSLAADGTTLKLVVDELERNVAPRKPHLLVALADHSLCMSALADRLGISSFVIPGPKQGAGDRLTIDKNLFTGLRQRLKSSEPLRVVIMDDIIATGKAAIVLSKTLRSAQMHVAHVACLIETPEGGRQAINRLGISVSSLVERLLSGELSPGSTTEGFMAAQVKNSRPKTGGKPSTKGPQKTL